MNVTRILTKMELNVRVSSYILHEKSFAFTYKNT